MIDSSLFRIGVLVVLPATLLSCNFAFAQSPAHFWLSTSDRSTGPEAPTINLPANASRRIYIWAQPAMNGPDFKDLQDISLNLTSDAPVFDFLDDFQIYNPASRFEPVITHDAYSAPPGSSVLRSQASGDSSDSIIGLTAGIAQTRNYTGIGLALPGDNGVTLGSSRAWLIGWADLHGVQGSGTSNVHLQIGPLGMVQSGESSSATNVVFGLPTDPMYNAGPDTVPATGIGNRNTTFPDQFHSDIDTPDLIVNGIAARTGDFNGDTQLTKADIPSMLSALADLSKFRTTRQISDSNLLAMGDFNGDGKLSNADIQGLLDLIASQSGGGTAQVVPEPSTSILAVLACGLLLISRLTRNWLLLSIV